jgi:hypothetical protein
MEAMGKSRDENGFRIFRYYVTDFEIFRSDSLKGKCALGPFLSILVI